MPLQIQRIFMSLPKETHSSNSPSLCTHCQAFYGSSAYHGLCSTCYKKGTPAAKVQVPAQEREQVPESVKEAVKEEATKEELQKDKKKCFTCNKKVGLLGTQCKCCFVFCNAHRLPESHSCGFDYREKGQKDLEKTVVKVSNGKIVKL